MNARSKAVFAVFALATSLVTMPAAQAQTERFAANLLGDSEVPPINSTGTASFQMEISGTTITFTMTFSGLSSNLVVSHLHFAPTKVAGGVMIFLCGGGGQPADRALIGGALGATIQAVGHEIIIKP